MSNTVSGVVSLQEHMDIVDDVEAIHNAFNDDTLDLAASYDIAFDNVNQLWAVTLYDESNVAIVTVSVEDVEVAEIYLDEIFDLEAIDHSERDSTAVASGSRWGHDVGGGGGGGQDATHTRWGHNTNASILSHDDGTDEDTGP